VEALLWLAASAWRRDETAPARSTKMDAGPKIVPRTSVADDLHFPSRSIDLWVEKYPVIRIVVQPERPRDYSIAINGAPAAIPKGAGQCLSGWMQSGNCCIEMRRH
jgi:hypothetical protein